MIRTPRTDKGSNESISEEFVFTKVCFQRILKFFARVVRQQDDNLEKSLSREKLKDEELAEDARFYGYTK